MKSPVITACIVSKDQPAALRLAVRSVLENAGALKGQVAVRIVLNDSPATVRKAADKWMGALRGGGVDIRWTTTAARDVYVAYNELAQSAGTPWVLLLNDDMVVGPDWAVPLLSIAAPDVWISPVLVEPGVVDVANVNVRRDFGRDVGGFDQEAFNAFVRRHRVNEVVPMGWFQPVLIHREKFLEIGGYPLEAPFPHPNDVALFRSLGQWGIRHVRHYGSWAYHFQRLSQRGETEGAKHGA